MDDWIDYYDSTHTIYAQQAASRPAFPDHRQGHNQLHHLADAVVLD